MLDPVGIFVLNSREVGKKLKASWFALDEIKGVKNWGHPSFLVKIGGILFF